MAIMGRYCKAYPVQRLREFRGWREPTQYLSPTRRQEDDIAGSTLRELTDDDYLYLQENFVVTDGIFLDEKIIFDEVTPEWIQFCKDTLGFEVPISEPVQGGAETS